MSDELVVEAMARAMRLAEPWSSFWSHADAKGLARAALAVARPAIRNEVLEEAARLVTSEDEDGCRYRDPDGIAAAIRSMKED